MALILRACVLSQKTRCWGELKILNRNMMNFKYSTSNLHFRNFAPILQLNQFSTSHPKSEIKPSLIYHGNLSRQIYAIKSCSLFTSAISLLVQPYIYTRGMETHEPTVLFGTMAALCTLAICTPTFLHLITKKYVHNIYYDNNKDKYTAETLSLFVRKKKIEFTADDVVVPEICGMFSTCTVKGIPLFIDETNFTEHMHFVKIMGLDKPIDFKLGKTVAFKMDPATVNVENSKYREIDNKH